MPLPLGTNDNSGDTEYLAMSSCLAKGYAYNGGYTKSGSLLWGRTPPMPVFSMIDFALNTYVYRRSFDVGGNNELQAVSALQLSSDCEKLILHITQLTTTNPIQAQGRVSYISIVWAMGGHYHTPMVRIEHNTPGVGDHTVMPNGLVVDPYGRAYAAFLHQGAQGRNSDNNAIINYSGKALVMGYDATNQQMMFYKEQTKFFGKSATLAYVDYGVTTANVYMGGSVDACHTSSTADAICWALAISRIRPDGSTSGTWEIQPNGQYLTNKLTAPYIDQMQVENGVLFGTTRSSSYNQAGSQVYVFKIQLDANGDPTPNNLIIQQLDPVDMPGDSFVTGVRPTLLVGGNMMHIVIRMNDQSMRYLEVIFGNRKGDGASFFTQVDAKHTVWIGTVPQVQNGVEMFECISAVSSSVMADVNFGETTAMVISNLSEDMCSEVHRQRDLGQADIAFLNLRPTLKKYDSQFSTLTLPAVHQVNDNVDYFSFGLQKPFMHVDDWCSTNSNPAIAVSGGTQYDPICAAWDGITYEYPFSPQIVTDPADCDVAGALIWDYDVLVIDEAGLPVEKLHLTMDPDAEVIRLTALEGPTVQGDFYIRVQATDPQLNFFEWTINVNFSPCYNPLITPPPITTQYYTVGQPYSEFTVGTFTYDDPLCIGSEVFSNQVVTPNTFITGLYDNFGDGKTVGWQTSNESDVGTYLIEVENYVGCQRYTVQYELVVESQCKAVPMTIDPTNTIFGNPAITQSVWQPAQSMFWSEADVDYTLTGGVTTCGPIIFELTDEFDNPVNPALFTTNGFNPTTLSVQTDDSTFVGLKNLKIKASFQNFPENTTEKPFTVMITDECETPTGSAPTIPDQSYFIGDPTLTVSSVPITYLPDYCPYSLEVTITPLDSINDATTTLTFTDFNMAYDFFTNDKALVGNYLVTTTALTPLGQRTNIAESFAIKYEDPCSTATFTFAPGFISEDPIQYKINTAPDLETFNDSFIISSAVGFNCGDIELTLTNLDGTPIDPNVWTWDPISQSLQTYTADANYYNNGIPYPFRITAKYAGTQYPIAGTFDFGVDLQDPCGSPTAVTSTPQTNPPDYLYTTAPSVDFRLNPFTVDPAICQPEMAYSCQIVVGPRLDICDKLGVSSFDPLTGNYMLQTTDMALYPPGTYTMQVSGTVGDKTATELVQITLVDPCTTAQITLLPTPFIDQTYKLNDPAVQQQWLTDSVATINTEVDCGAWAVEVFNDDLLQTQIDTTTFRDQRFAGTNDFVTMQTTDISKVGTYPFKYRVYPVNYPGNVMESPNPFTVTIEDSCSPPTSLVAPALIDQEYTITDFQDFYQIPQFTVEPAFCDVRYSYTITDIAGDAAVDFNADPASRTFTFSNIDDLLLAGQDFTDYTITVTAESGNTAVFTASSDFNLRINNPCVDPAYVSILSQPMPVGLTYELYEFNATGFPWTHSDFILQTQPMAHDLCGGLVYDCQFMGQIVDPTTSDVSYDTATNTFNIYSEDRALIGMQDFACVGKLEDYPLTASEVTQGQIEIIDPCLQPNEIQVPPQPVYPDYSYTGLAHSFTLEPFTTWPPGCGIDTYTCSMVSGARLDLCNLVDGATQSSFDPTTGTYSFQSIDNVNYPPGDYVFRFTGTSGTSEGFVDMTLTLIDPCATTPLTLLPSPLIDQTYTLRDPAATQEWTFDQVVMKETLANCGPYEIEFFNDDPLQTPISTIIFDNQVQTDPAVTNVFTTLETADLLKIGQYPIRYRVKLRDYPTNVVEATDPFTITIGDSCAPPTSLVAPALIDQEYTITDVQDTYQVPEFTVEPAFCDVRYSYTITDPAGDKAVFFDSDPASRTFTFDNINDLLLAGQEFTDYTITVTAEAGNDQVVAATSDFNLRINNPCVDPAYVSILSQPMPVGLTYELYEFNATGFPWTHSDFILQTQPMAHDLCGGLVYDCQFMGQIVDPTTSDVSYDTATNTFNIYSEDRALIGMQDFACVGKLEDYPLTASEVTQGQIEIIDPCLQPNEIYVPPQTDPADYYYTGEFNEFNLVAFETWPPGCLFEDYQLEMIAGPRLDLIGLLDGDTASEFDPASGTFRFKSTDVPNYPPGDYVFNMIGTSGTNQASVVITMTLVDPCPDTQLTLLPTPFIDQDYVLRDPAQSQLWLLDTLAEQASPADCGNFVVEFYQDDGIVQTTLDTIFIDSRSVDEAVSPSSFGTLQTEDVAKIGSYPIMYRVRLEDYPTNYIESPEPFIVTVIDPCDKPISLEAPELEDQAYTITDVADIYQIPPFVSTPAWCDITYTYTIEDPEGDAALTFDADQDSRTFTFENLQDLFLAGKNQTEYIVTVEASVGNIEPVTNSSDFSLTLKNPCIDPDFVQITTAPLLDQTYTLYHYNLTGFEWTHPESTVTTVPFQHDYCGALVYDATFMTAVADEETRPLVHSDESMSFNLYSEERPIVGIRPYTLQAKFANYNSMASAVQTAYIEIVDPCSAPGSIDVTPQVDPPIYYYSGQLNRFTLNPFESWPPGCDFSYDCISVEGPDSDVECNMPGGVGQWRDIGSQTTYDFNTIDMSAYDPGVYNFTIRGSVGTDVPITADTHFILDLRDPCPTAQLVVGEEPLRDMFYYLGDEPIVRTFNMYDSVKLTTPVNCGQIYVKIQQLFGNQPGRIEQNYFNIDQNNPSNGKFVVKATEEVERLGVYDFQVVYYLLSYDRVRTEGTPFEVHVLDPCTPERLQLLRYWPLVCPKPPPAEITVQEMPVWMKELEDQVVYVGESIEYELGEPVSIYGDPMDVKLNYGRAGSFLNFDPDFTSHEAVGLMMSNDDVGYYQVEVKGNYTDAFGKEVRYSTYFIQTVLPSRLPISQIKEGDIIHYIEDWEHGIRYSAEPEPYNPSLPQPFVESLSPTGLLTIGWSQRMVPFDDYLEMKSRKVAIRPNSTEMYIERGVGHPEAGKGEVAMVEGEVLGGEPSRRRRLAQYENWFVDRPGYLEEKINIFDGIEVEITPKDDPSRVVEYDWYVQGYNEHFLWLKFDFAHPETLSEFENFDEVKITFWETMFFQSIQEKPVGYGTTIYWGMYRQVSQETADRLDRLFNIFLAMILVVMAIVILLLCCGGRLTPTWMFLNSLSLIAHLPMLAVLMPANLHYFLWKWLQVYSLRSENLDYDMEVWRKLLSEKNYDIAIDEDSSYHILLNDCGYKHAFARNLLIFASIAAVFFLIWAILFVRAVIVKRCCPRYFEREKACASGCKDSPSCKKAGSFKQRQKDRKGCRFAMAVSCRQESERKQKPIGWEPWWANFGLRFLYMVFFEVCLSIVMNLFVVDFNLTESFFLWLFSCFIVGLTVFALLGLAYLFCRKGPYHSKTYQDKMLMQSFWGKRPLTDEVRQKYDQEFQEWLVKDTEETRQFFIQEDIKRRVKKRESKRLRQSCCARIQCKKRPSKLDTPGKQHDQGVYDFEDLTPGEQYPRDFLMSEQGVLSKPLDKGTPSGTTPSRGGDSSTQKKSEDQVLSGNVIQVSSPNQDGVSSSRDLSDMIQIAHLEESSLEKSDPSIAIERLSHNRGKSHKSSEYSGSSFKKDLKGESRFNKHSLHDRSVNQIEMELDAMQSLHRAKNQSNLFSSPSRSSAQNAVPKVNSSYNEQMEQVVSEDGTPRNYYGVGGLTPSRRQDFKHQELYEGGEAVLVENPRSPKDRMSDWDESRLIDQIEAADASRRDQSEALSSSRRSGSRQAGQDLDNGSLFGRIEEEEARGRRTQMGRDPYADDYDTKGGYTDEGGMETERPLMISSAAPIDLSDLKKTSKKQQGDELAHSTKFDLDQEYSKEYLKDYQKASKKYSELTWTDHQVEAKFRIWLSEKLEPTNRYRTLFYGLRLNTPHNGAIVQPFSFLVRRVLYTFIVIFMLRAAYFGVILLILTCLYFQIFVVTERPWALSIVNQQHFVNECGLLFLLVHIALFDGLVNDVYGRLWLGWYLIWVVCAIIIYNLIVILWHSMDILKEMWARHKKLYPLFYPDKWCYCCRKRKLCKDSKPSEQYLEEPSPLEKPAEPIGYWGEVPVPGNECIEGVCEEGCDGRTGEAHQFYSRTSCVTGLCSHDCDGKTGEVHQYRRQECVSGICSHDCDGYTGSVHNSAPRKCVRGVCSHDCDGFTGVVHYQEKFVEIEHEKPDPYPNNGEKVLEMAIPETSEEDCSQCSESDESICSFEPDELPKPQLDDSKGSFEPDALPKPQLDDSKGSFQPDALDEADCMKMHYVEEIIMPATPPADDESICSQEGAAQEEEEDSLARAEESQSLSDGSQSSYEEVEVKYQVTERIMAGGEVTTEKVEVFGDTTKLEPHQALDIKRTQSLLQSTTKGGITKDPTKGRGDNFDEYADFDLNVDLPLTKYRNHEGNSSVVHHQPVTDTPSVRKQQASVSMFKTEARNVDLNSSMVGNNDVFFKSSNMFGIQKPHNMSSNDLQMAEGQNTMLSWRSQQKPGAQPNLAGKVTTEYLQGADPYMETTKHHGGEQDFYERARGSTSNLSSVEDALSMGGYRGQKQRIDTQPVGSGNMLQSYVKAGFKSRKNTIDEDIYDQQERAQSHLDFNQRNDSQSMGGRGSIDDQQSERSAAVESMTSMRRAGSSVLQQVGGVSLAKPHKSLAPSNDMKRQVKESYRTFDRHSSLK